EPEVLGPAVDPRLELRVREGPVLLGVAAAEEVEVDAVQHRHAHGGTLSRDQRVERSAHLRLGELRAGDRPARSLEQDEPDSPALDLLVAPERRPRALAVDAHRAWAQDVLDGGGLEAGEPKRR